MTDFEVVCIPPFKLMTRILPPMTLGMTSMIPIMTLVPNLAVRKCLLELLDAFISNQCTLDI